ncbi:MAG TPA: integrase core domain-containing protein [Gemmatales bacterium]|nr:integrase core domain-containing protein [Gemmatales bacterium]
MADCRDSLWSLDFFRCESIALRSHWVMVVMDIYSRRIIGFGVCTTLSGQVACQMFNRIIAGKTLPQYLCMDNDPVFRYHRWVANLAILEIEPVRSIPCVPRSHPYVERLIGTIRREFLDHTLFWNERDLLRKLDQFRHYYNHSRGHLGLDGITPDKKANNEQVTKRPLTSYSWQSHCNGLFVSPVAV